MSSNNENEFDNTSAQDENVYSINLDDLNVSEENPDDMSVEIDNALKEEKFKKVVDNESEKSFSEEDSENISALEFEELVDENFSTGELEIEEVQSDVPLEDIKIKKDISKPVFFVTIVALVFLIIGAVSIFILMQKNFKAKELEKGTIISQNRDTLNSANFIYVPEKTLEDFSDLEVVKMLIDSKKTEIYFNSKLDYSKYNFVLVDNFNKRYVVDELDINSKSFINEKVPFKPFDVGITSFSLEVNNLEDNMSNNFKYTFAKPLSKTPVKHFSGLSVIEHGDNKIKVKVDESSFSSAGSSIDFSVESEDKNIIIIPNYKSDLEDVSILEGSKEFARDKQLITNYFSDEQKFVGTLNFGPVTNLDSKLTIKLGSFAEKFPINIIVRPQEVWHTNTDPEKIINLGSYKVFLERMGRANYTFVLVLHAEKTNEDVSSKDNERVEVFPDIDLVITKPDGTIEVIKGSVKTGVIGADVTFNAKDYAEYFDGSSLYNLQLRINSFMINGNSSGFEVDLSKASDSPLNSYLSASQAIKSSFESRLEYKSGLIQKKDVNGFDETILNNDAIQKIYNPNSIHKESFYDINIVSLSLIDGKFFAIVDEIWKPTIDSKDFNFKYRHNIIGEVGFNSYLITNDSITNLE